MKRVTSKRQCIKKEVIWDYFRRIAQENSHKVQSIFPDTDLTTLAQVLGFSYHARISDIEYYSNLLSNFEDKLTLLEFHKFSDLLNK